MRGSAAMATAEPFTLEDGHVTFFDDGSTELHIVIPPGMGEDSNLIGRQYDRFVTRLLVMALAWQRNEEDNE